MNPAKRLKAWIAPADYEVTDKSGLMEVDIEDFTVEHDTELPFTLWGTGARVSRIASTPTATIVGRLVANYPKKIEEPTPVSREETTMTAHNVSARSNTIHQVSREGGVRIDSKHGKTLASVERDCDYGAGSRDSFFYATDGSGYVSPEHAVLVAAELVANSQGRENVNVEYGTNIGVHGTTTETITHSAGSGSAIARVYEPTSDDQAQRSLNFALANLNAYKAWVDGKDEREKKAVADLIAKAEAEAAETAAREKAEREKAIDAKVVAVFRQMYEGPAGGKSDAFILDNYRLNLRTIRETLAAADAL